MNIPAMPSRNSGLAERNITEAHHRLESCTKTDGRSRAKGTLSRNDPLNLAAKSLDHGPTDALTGRGNQCLAPPR
jgi:hypothetical protein